MTLNDQIAKVNAQINRAIKDDENAKLLMSIPGIGAYTALTIAADLDGIERFHKPHELCSYSGLVAKVSSSGETTHYGYITRKGSDMLRWVLVAVHSHVRYAKKSSVTKFYNRVAKKR